MDFPVVTITGIATIVLPVAAIAWMAMSKMRSRCEWLLKGAIAGGVVSFVFFAGMWPWLSYYLRYILLLVFIAVLLQSYRNSRPLSLTTGASGGWLPVAGGIVAIVVLALLNVLVIRGFFYEGEGIEILFPMKDGKYYVFQGGNSPITNLFHSFHPISQYALDIIEVNEMGARASLSPDTVYDYNIFGDTLYSPCDCVVREAIGGLPDNTPGAVDTINTAGNHVVLERGGVYVVLAHMMRGSLMVKRGDTVKRGMAIGRIGNSGNTAEPHLHIHAMRIVESAGRSDSVGVPMIFGGRFLSINDVVSD